MSGRAFAIYCPCGRFIATYVTTEHPPVLPRPSCKVSDVGDLLQGWHLTHVNCGRVTYVERQLALAFARTDGVPLTLDDTPPPLMTMNRASAETLGYSVS